MKQLFAMALSVFLTAGVQAQSDLPFNVEAITSFDEPWALAFLPDGRMLVTEKKGNLLIVSQDGEKSRSIGGIPDVDYGGQGGLGDVALHPDFAENGLIYLSYAEAGAGGTRGAAVMRAVLKQTERGRVTRVPLDASSDAVVKEDRGRPGLAWPTSLSRNR